MGQFYWKGSALAPPLNDGFEVVIEAVARALEDGRQRDLSRPAISEGEKAAQKAEDRQDAEIVRVAAYSGLRIGELLALRWGDDIDFADRRSPWVMLDGVAV